MNIGKQKISKVFLDKIKGSKENEFPYNLFKNLFVEERLYLGSYGIIDLFFHKKLEDEEGYYIKVNIVTICNTLLGFDEILKSSKSKRGVFKYIRECVEISPKTRIYYTNTILCPGVKEEGFDMLVNDIDDLYVFVYDFNHDGFTLFSLKEKLRVLVPSKKTLNTIKRRLS